MSERDSAMPDLPAPLTPADCDLRGYDFMPLFGNRLFGSRLYTKALRNPRAGLAAIKLWWVAWQQCPAGSLPDDDDDLAMLADFGTDAKGWRAVREVALHGFVRCSDGRLYHPILCTEALDAFDRRRRERDRKARLRSKRDGTDGGSSADVPPSVPRDNPGTDGGSSADVRADRTGQDRTGQDKEEGGLASSRVEARVRRRTTPEPEDLPAWIPPDPWNAWLAMRRQKRAPATGEAIRLSIRDLERFREAGHDPEAVLNQSIQRGWTGLFEPAPSRSSQTSGRLEAWDRIGQHLDQPIRHTAGRA